jgi:uncharacterized protein (DUF2147 family)
MMKPLTIAAAILFAGAAYADPVEGTWQTSKDDNGNFGHIEVGMCGSAVCGTLVRAYNGAGEQIDTPNVGRQIIWDMEPNGDGTYGGGKVYSPDRDKTYSSKMTLAGDRLNVKGCVLGICRDGGKWARVK